MALSGKAASLELALNIDNSGSVGLADFNLEKANYVSALTSILPTDGSVAIGVWDFSTSVRLDFDERVIASAADKADLLAAIAGIPYIGGNTALGPSIAAATARLIQSDIVAGKKVIDVSTDGIGNVGINQVTARDAALAAGIDQINGLLVGSASSSSFVGGTGSFFEVANTPADFQAAIDRKLVHEIQGAPDAGSTYMLLGMGLLGLAGLRRRCA